jgi:hypothetical protein
MSTHTAAATPAARRPRNPVANHPNASLALASGSGLGAVVVWLARLSGADMPPEVATVIGGAVAAGFLFIGRRGIRGAVLGLWGGTD